MPKAFKNYKEQGVVQIYLRQLLALYNLRDAISKPKAPWYAPAEVLSPPAGGSKKRTESNPNRSTQTEAHRKQPKPKRTNRSAQKATKIEAQEKKAHRDTV